MAVNPNSFPQDKESITESLSLRLLPFSLRGYGLRLVVDKEAIAPESCLKSTPNHDYDRKPLDFDTLTDEELEVWPVRERRFGEGPAIIDISQWLGPEA